MRRRELSYAERLKIARERAVSMGLVGHDPNNRRPMFAHHSNDPTKLAFGLMVTLPSLIEIAANFPFMRQVPTKYSTAVYGTWAILFFVGLICLSATRRYGYSKGKAPFWRLVFVTICLVCGVLCALASPYLPAVGIWYYQGIAMCWFFLILAAAPGWFVAKRVWSVQ